MENTILKVPFMNLSACKTTLGNIKDCLHWPLESRLSHSKKNQTSTLKITADSYKFFDNEAKQCNNGFSMTIKFANNTITEVTYPLSLSNISFEKVYQQAAKRDNRHRNSFVCRPYKANKRWNYIAKIGLEQFFTKYPNLTLTSVLQSDSDKSAYLTEPQTKLKCLAKIADLTIVEASKYCYIEKQDHTLYIRPDTLIPNLLALGFTEIFIPNVSLSGKEEEKVITLKQYRYSKKLSQCQWTISSIEYSSANERRSFTKDPHLIELFGQKTTDLKTLYYYTNNHVTVRACYLNAIRRSLKIFYFNNNESRKLVDKYFDWKKLLSNGDDRLPFDTRWVDWIDQLKFNFEYIHSVVESILLQNGFRKLNLQLSSEVDMSELESETIAFGPSDVYPGAKHYYIEDSLEHFFAWCTRFGTIDEFQIYIRQPQKGVTRKVFDLWHRSTRGGTNDNNV